MRVKMKVPFRLSRLPGQCFMTVFVILMTCMNFLCQQSFANVMGDACDWTGSGLSSNEAARSVTPVYLRCSQGEITWVYPRGALRVLLRMGGTQREFRGCVRSGLHSAGARLFLEARRSLRLLRADEKAQCFTSSGGMAAIYVEAVDNRDVVDKKVASFFYDLQALPRGEGKYDAEEECRPCFPDELIQQYCTSDFVARGFIININNNDDLDRAEISTRVNAVYHQHVNIFHHQQDSVEDVLLIKNHQQHFQLLSRNDLNSTNHTLDYRGFEEGFLYGTVYLPLHCEAKFGPGEFIFMGRMMLGDPYLKCAPRLEDWLEVRRKAMDNGDAQCLLET